MILILDSGTPVDIPNFYYEKIDINILDKYYAAKMLKSFDTRDEFFKN